MRRDRHNPLIHVKLRAVPQGWARQWRDQRREGHETYGRVATAGVDILKTGACRPPLIRPSGTFFAFLRSPGAKDRFATGSKSPKGRRKAGQPQTAARRPE